MTVNESLRPTNIRFSLSGPISDSFNAPGTTKQNYAGTLIAVPAGNPMDLGRPVRVSVDERGGATTNSFNNSGSLTVLVNEFLNRRIVHMHPLALRQLNRLEFSFRARNITNCFNG